MSVRRPRRPASIRRPADRRRRVLTSAAAVVALLAVAAVVGSRSDDGGGTGGPGTVNTQATGRSAGGSKAAALADETTAGDATAYASTTMAASPEAGGTTDTDGGTDGGAGSSGRGLAGAPADAKIIRTGSLQVEVKREAFADGTAGLTRIATGLGGFVSASEISSFEDDPRGTVTLRIPAKQFDKAVAEVGKLGTVQALTTGSQDVTGEYTDVASRLKALEAEREQINLVLSRAESIPDILAVRDRLAAVQGEIEQHQGRQKVLDDQTSLSTLTVELSEQGSVATDTQPAPVRTGFSKLWHDGVDRFTDGGRSIALGLATLAPWLLLALVLWFPARLAWRRLAPVDGAPAGAPPATTAD